MRSGAFRARSGGVTVAFRVWSGGVTVAFRARSGGVFGGLPRLVGRFDRAA
jgi:hypothetical protein